MSGKGAKSKKKPVETTLGKGPPQPDVDVAHLRKPIETSVNNVRHVVSLLQTATLEVKNYITYECDIIYECKSCKTLFRSLANFILHKRTYCTEKYSAFICNVNTDENKSVRGNTPEIAAELDACNKKTLSPIIKKLHNKQKIIEMAQQDLEEDLTDKIDAVQEKTEDLTQQTMLLEPIETTKTAVFQTMVKQETPEEENCEHMKSEVMELHGIQNSDQVVLNQDGSICPFKTDQLNSKHVQRRREFACLRCSQKFSTRKTLSYHMKYKHNRTRMVFMCPDCKYSFATAWGVYRHLYKVHRKTSAQVRRMRDQVHNNVIRRDHEPAKKKEEKSVEKTDDENQWLNNFEGDNDLQMCGGCGKRFERKAALNSHSTMCLKRIAVCNSIKENSRRKESEQEKDVKVSKKTEKVLDRVKGSAKRKPHQVRTYRPPATVKMPKLKIEVPVDINLNKVRRRTSSDDQPPCIIANEPECKVHIEKLNGSLNKPPAEPKNNKKKSSLIVFRRRSSRIDKTMETGFMGFRKEESKVAQEYNNLLQESVEIKKEIIEMEMANSNEAKTPEDVIIKIEKPDEIEDKVEVPSKTIFKSLSETNIFDDYEVVPKFNGDDEKAKTIKFNKKNVKPKRRRTCSFEVEESLRLQEDNNLCIEANDISFLSKAAPYMDKMKLCCKPCDETFPDYSVLMWHMSTHFSWFRFQCSRCTFVSFNKHDCAEHARIKHGIHHSLIPSVVLPIPNWKSVLMSHDFTSLQNNIELSGKLTDEVIILSSEEQTKDLVLENLSDDGKQPVPDLFCDYNPVKNEFEFPLDKAVKSEIIDIIEDNKVIDITEDNNDSFQLEMPQEIYSHEVLFERLDNLRSTPEIPSIKQEPPDEDEESFLPVLKKPEVPISPIKEEPTETCDILFAPKLPLRSARNRTRSIKTLQADFLYDLTKVLKLNDASRVSRNRKRKISKSPEQL